jgi:microcin C transport system substrate-binding protein
MVSCRFSAASFAPPLRGGGRCEAMPGGAKSDSACPPRSLALAAPPQGGGKSRNLGWLKIACLLLTLFLSPLAHAAEPATTTSHGAAIFGDLKYPKDFTHFDYVNPAAPKGGVIKLAATGTFDSVNPFLVKGIAAAGVTAMFDALLASSEDEPASAYGLIAETVTRPADNSWVEFTLRKQAQFSDGSPIRPEDVIFTFNTMKEKGHPQFRGYYRDVVKAEKTAANKVRFTFKDGSNRELATIIGQFPILSETFFKTHDFTQAGMTPLLGSGPYLIESAEPGKSIRYKRNPNYWAKDLAVNKGRHNFDVVQYDYYRDDTVSVQALLAGHYDFRAENIARIWANSYNTPAVKEGKIVKVQIPHSLPSGMQGIFFNLRREKFGDVKVRRAISLAFDFEWSNKNLFNSAYKRNNSYFTNSDLASSGLPSAAELALLEPFRAQLPPELFTTPFTLPVNNAPGDLRAQLLIAKNLLKEAGWDVKNGQLRNAKGEPLTIEFLLHSQSFERVFTPYIKNLETLGIKANIRLIDPAQYQKRLDTYDFDMTIQVIAQTLTPGNEQLTYWHSSKINEEGGRNISGIQNPVVDALVEEIIRAKDRPALVAATHALDRVLLHSYLTVPNWHTGTHRLIYWNKFGQPKTPPKYGLGVPENWWWVGESTKAP